MVQLTTPPIVGQNANMLSKLRRIKNYVCNLSMLKGGQQIEENRFITMIRKGERGRRGILRQEEKNHMGMNSTILWNKRLR